MGGVWARPVTLQVLPLSNSRACVCRQGYFRQAAALQSLGRLEDALVAYVLWAALEPTAALAELHLVRHAPSTVQYTHIRQDSGRASSEHRIHT